MDPYWQLQQVNKPVVVAIEDRLMEISKSRQESGYLKFLFSLLSVTKELFGHLATVVQGIETGKEKVYTESVGILTSFCH